MHYLLLLLLLLMMLLLVPRLLRDKTPEKKRQNNRLLRTARKERKNKNTHTHVHTQDAHGFPAEIDGDRQKPEEKKSYKTTARLASTIIWLILLSIASTASQG